MMPKKDQKAEVSSDEGRTDVPPSLLNAESGRTPVGPTTDHMSRKVMLRAERRDTVAITGIERRFNVVELPDEFTVVQRTSTYYGPELLLAAEGRNYLLTAPGPDTHLLLWRESVNEREYRESWTRTAEVRVSIEDTSPYDICEQCGNPIRSEEHERLSALNRCLEGS